jgi:hypothetical protein
MNSFVAQLSKWTPLSMMALAAVGSVAFIVIWYGIHYQDPPQWILYVLTGIFGGGVFGVGHIAGVTSANGVAKSTAAATVAAFETTKGTAIDNSINP